MTGQPLVVAKVVARNIVPLAGIVFLGWNALPVLALYLLDTILSIAVIFAGVLRRFAPPIEDDGWAARINGEAGLLGGGLFAALVFAVPFGLPLFFMAPNDTGWGVLLDDPAFRVGAVGQAIAAFWSYVELWRAQRVATVEQLRLKRRFNLVTLRWLVMVVAAYAGLGLVFGRFSPIVFVALYVVASTWAELAPDRFLRVLPGLADGPELSPLPRPAASKPKRRPRKAARR